MTFRALARSSALITLANLLPRAGALLLLPIYARFLTTADFGIVSLASSTALLLSIAYRLGLDAALLRMHHDVDPSARRSLYVTIAAISLACAAAVTILGAIVVPAVSGGDAARTLMPVLPLALAIGALNTFQYVPSVWLRATEQTGRYLVLALGAFGAVVVVTLALVVLVRLGAVGSLAGQLAGALVMAASALAILWRQRPWRVSGALARRALAFGLPLLPHTLAGWLLNVSDRWMLGLLLGLTAAEALGAVGVYSLGYQLGYAVGLAAISFNAAWLPFLYRVGDGPHGASILRPATTLIISCFMALAAALAILAPDLIAVIAPVEWAAAAEVTAVVAFASAANAAGLMFASGIYLAHSTRVMPLLTMAAAGVNVACNVVLIPRIGIMGAAWATLAAYAALAAMIAFAAARLHPLRIEVPRLAAVGLIAVAGAALSRSSPLGGALPQIGWHIVLAAGTTLAILALTRAAIGELRAAITPARGAPQGLG